MSSWIKVGHSLVLRPEHVIAVSRHRENTFPPSPYEWHLRVHLSGGEVTLTSWSSEETRDEAYEKLQRALGADIAT